MASPSSPKRTRESGVYALGKRASQAGKRASQAVVGMVQFATEHFTGTQPNTSFTRDRTFSQIEIHHCDSLQEVVVAHRVWGPPQLSQNWGDTQHPHHTNWADLYVQARCAVRCTAPVQQRTVRARASMRPC